MACNRFIGYHPAPGELKALDDLYRFIPGPSWVHPDVLRAQARAPIGHRDQLTGEMGMQCEAGLKAVFQTENRIYISTSSGSGMMEAAVRNLVHSRCLHLVCGAFSERWFKMSVGCGKSPDKIDAVLGEGISAEKLDSHLRANAPYEAIFITHSETATGVVNPLENICRVARSYPDMLVCVDTVSSMAGVSIPVDEWGIDFCVTSSQKCFSLPPGLAFASVSPRCLEKAVSVANRGWYFDFLNLEKHAPRGYYPSTPAITLMYALAHQLARILAEGLPQRWLRHAQMAEHVKGWVAANMDFFARDGYRSPTVTTVRNTRAISFPDLSAFLAQRGFAIANGYGDLKDSTFRIAHMGDMPMPKVDELLDTLSDFLRR